MTKDYRDLYTLLDLKLDNIAEKILLSKVDDGDKVYSNILSHIETIFIQAALKITDNNISKAARLLGMNRNTLSKKLRVPSSHRRL
ncbi:MAG: DNA-binding protein Fis [Syntrophorhabdus sp. PtaB.Bin184]|jgi:DNA-binding protein Fis|nr:MAG: DNA-binding protein Fis [Syntrophorhabdus sp. PtaB.Bin184]